METKVEALEDNKVKVTVTIEAAEIDNRIKKTYKDFAFKYNFPGFRKGKAPRPVIDNALGAEAVRATVTDALVNESYPQVINESGLYPVGRPEFEDDGLVEAGKDYAFTFTVSVKPEFELSSYEPVEIEMPAEGASDAEVDEQIEALREHYYDYVDASAATKVKPENFVQMAMKVTSEKGTEISALTTESRLYGIGSGSLNADFDAEIMGMKKGQTKEFTLLIPADETAALLAPHAGKKLNFEVTITVVKNKVLPEATDEWAKDTLGFESLADMRERIAESLAAQKAEMLPRIKENACLAELIKRLEGDVPEGLVEESESSLLQDFFAQLQRQGMTFDAYLAQQGLTNEQFKEDVKMQALDMTKQDLALDAWARHAKMEATAEEVRKEFEVAGVPNPEELYKEWSDRGQLYLVRSGVLRTKAVLDIMETAKVTEVEFAAKAEEKPKKKAAAKKSTKKAEDGEKKPAAKKTAKKADEATEEAAE